MGPGRQTRAVFAACLAALAISWLLTHSEAVQFVLLFGFMYVARRVDGGPVDRVEGAEGLSSPWRIVGLSVLLVLPVGVAVYFLAGAIDLRLFWFFALMWALLEIYVAMLRREIERNGVSGWTPERPIRDALLSGAVTVPLLAALALWDGAGTVEALLTGLACGFIVFAFGLLSAWIDRRSR